MYKIVITDHFKKQLKKLIKKDPFLRDKVKNSLNDFKKSNTVSIGSGVYKIRIARTGQGKSSGYRAYIFVMELENILTPICIYAKNVKETLGYEELTQHLVKIKDELNEL